MNFFKNKVDKIRALEPIKCNREIRLSLVRSQFEPKKLINYTLGN